MINSSQSLSSQDERIMAALSHISIVLPLIGVLCPILIWVTQKEKSKFVAYQALQALIYHLSMILGYFTCMSCYVCSFMFNFISIPMSSSYEVRQIFGSTGEYFFFIPFIVMGMMLIGGFIFIVYGIVGSILVFQGRPFRYVIIGKRVEKMMLKG
jgi:uncharacterized Tic20 family protein